MIIQIANLNKSYAFNEITINALSDINLSIKRGEYITFLGTSKAGKTALMNILAFLDRPTQGKYFFEKLDTSTISEKEIAQIKNFKIGYIKEERAFISNFTVSQNIELPMIYAGVEKNEREKRLGIVLNRMGILDRKHDKIYELSDGEKQKVLIAREIVNRPTVLLVDEPIRSLDKLMSEEINTLFKQLNVEGTTIIVATRSTLIAGASKRVISLKDGQIVKDMMLSKTKKSK